MSQEKEVVSAALVPASGANSLSVKNDADSVRSAKQTRQAVFTPANLTEAIALSKMIANSNIVPKEFKGKPADVLVAIQLGSEIGLAPLQALQGIAVINGRPTVWGDSALAVVQAHPAYEWHRESVEGQGDTRYGVCQVKRRGAEPHTSKFSVSDAKLANLWGKIGPWKQYPDRMLVLRARGFALRNQFADALRGMAIAEEAMDIPVDNQERRQREVSTLDVSALSPSSEPNRGHNDTGFEKPQEQVKTAPDPQNQESKKPDDVMCAECSVINGHADTCSQKTKAAQDAKTSHSTRQVRLTIRGEMVKKSNQRTKKKWSELPVLLEDGSESTLYIWDSKKAERFHGMWDGIFRAEVSDRAGSGDKMFMTLEHILMLKGKQYVNDEPVEDTGDVPTAGELGFPETGDEPVE